MKKEYMMSNKKINELVRKKLSIVFNITIEMKFIKETFLSATKIVVYRVYNGIIDGRCKL